MAPCRPSCSATSAVTRALAVAVVRHHSLTIPAAWTVGVKTGKIKRYQQERILAITDPDSVDPRGYGYAVFGKVTSGMDVVDKIAKVPTGNHGYYENVPTTPVIIKSVKIISEK